MTRVRIPILLAVLAVTASQADAQTFGTFTWQMQPYCNRVTLTLSSTPGGFTVAGSDDQCGAAKKGSAAGVAVFNPDGTVGLNFLVVTAPGGAAVPVSASVSPASGQGTWADAAGHSGTFAFFGSTGGLPPRPSSMAPMDVADNPNDGVDPCNVPTTRPTLLLCGTGTGRWLNGGYGLPGLQVWRGGDGQVRIRGSATRSAGIGGIVFVLPAPFVPKRTLGITVSTGLPAGVHRGGTALLVVYGPEVPSAAGLVAVFSESTAGHMVVHLGEVAFRVDQ